MPYIDEYEIHEGIQLDKDKMEFNPGLRLFAKICLNCLWGYLSQRGNKEQQTHGGTAMRRIRSCFFSD